MNTLAGSDAVRGHGCKEELHGAVGLDGGEGSHRAERELAHPIGQMGDAVGLSPRVESKFCDLVLREDLRATHTDFLIARIDRIEADLSQVGAMDGIDLCVSVSKQIDPSTLGHFQEIGHVGEESVRADDDILQSRSLEILFVRSGIQNFANLLLKLLLLLLLLSLINYRRH